MGDLRQIAFNEKQKLSAKLKKEAAERAAREAAGEPPVSRFSRISQTGIPVAGATVIDREIMALFIRLRDLAQRVTELEHAARSSVPVHLRRK